MRLGIPSVTGTAVGIGRETWAVGAAMAPIANASRRRPGRGSREPLGRPNRWCSSTGSGTTMGPGRPLGARLGVAGFFDFTPVTYGVDDEVPRIAARIADQVDALLVSRSVERVHLIGHSLGGVAIRYWHDMLGGYARPPMRS